MYKRVVAVPLWFVSVWMLYGLIAYFAGLPSNGGAILGALSAAFVWMDPTGGLWGGRSQPSAGRLAIAPPSGMMPVAAGSQSPRSRTPSRTWNTREPTDP